MISGLPKSTASALNRNARRLGVTVEAYVKELIADDIRLDRAAGNKTIAELSTPFQKSLKDLSEKDLDALVRPSLRRTNGMRKR